MVKILSDWIFFTIPFFPLSPLILLKKSEEGEKFNSSMHRQLFEQAYTLKHWDNPSVVIQITTYIQ